MNALTIDQVMSFQPCGHDEEDDGKHYTRNRVTQLFAGRETVSAMDVLTCSDVPDEDKLWLVLRPELLPEMTLHELACDFAQSVISIVETLSPGEKRPQNAINVKRRWIRGEASDAELAAACDAARDACDAACDAARAAVRDARATACDAACDAAWDARAAACDAACDAAWDAAWDAARAAAWAAARNGARAAARDARATACDAARATACDAAWATACDAACDAAWDAANKSFVKMVIARVAYMNN